jgi:hypothetical protein
MGTVKLRYYTLRRRSGKVTGYWQPSKVMREAGFALVNCGQDGPAAWRIAEEWNRRWDEYRRGAPVRRWPVGSVGSAFDGFRQTGVWAAKKPRTREDWERGWAYISHAFGEVAPETIVLAQIDAWYRSIVDGKVSQERMAGSKDMAGAVGRDDSAWLLSQGGPIKGNQEANSTSSPGRLARTGNSPTCKDCMAVWFHGSELYYCRGMGCCPFAG